MGNIYFIIIYLFIFLCIFCLLHMAWNKIFWIFLSKINFHENILFTTICLNWLLLKNLFFFFKLFFWLWISDSLGSSFPRDWRLHTFNYIHGVKSRIKMWVFRWKSCWKRLKKAFKCAVTGCSARVVRLVLERAQRSSASNAQATRAIECSFQWLKLYLATLQMFLALEH